MDRVGCKGKDFLRYSLVIARFFSKKSMISRLFVPLQAHLRPK